MGPPVGIAGDLLQLKLDRDKRGDGVGRLLCVWWEIYRVPISP